MIRARKNKKAPAVNPVVVATSGEGSRTNPTQEEIQMDNSIALDTDNASVELSEYERMELEFDALAADKGLTPGSALWQLERRSFCFYTADTLTAPVELRAGARPVWADPAFDVASTHGDGAYVSSRPWEMRMDLHPGMLTEDLRISATARARLMQRASEVDPFVILDRFADCGDGIARVPGSESRFTLDEAAELAHLLLLVVDVARGTSDDNDPAVA